MLIASSIVKVIPGNEEILKEDINQIQGVEVVAQEDGNLVIVLESKTTRELEGITEKISKLPKVMGVFPVYINMEALAQA
ncbi:MAG: chaperone NapD [Bacillota bacterium]|nr:chaperone NapD [Bacillota bacterium]